MALVDSRFRLYLFYLLVFSLPWQTRWIIQDTPIKGEVWEYGRISLYGWDILLILLLFISWWAIIEIIKQRWPTEQKFKIYLLLLFVSFFSIFWSGDKLLSLVWSLRLLEGGLLWLLFFTVKPQLKNIFISLAAAGTIQALWGIGQFLTQGTFTNKWLGVAVHPLTTAGTSVVLTDWGRYLRAYAGQTHPNVLGGLLVITCLATVWLYINKDKSDNSKVINHLIISTYIVQLAGLFFTFSRGAWLALFFSLLYWLLTNKQAIKEMRRIFIVSAVVIVMLGGIFWQPTLGRITSQSKLEQQSFEERATSFEQGKNISENLWYRGVGMGNFTVELQRRQPDLKSWSYQPVHNVYLLVLSELGILGLLIFLGILWQQVRPKRYLQINYVFMGAIIFIFLFDHYWWTMPSMFLLFWLLTSLSELDGNNRSTEHLT